MVPVALVFAENVLVVIVLLGADAVSLVLVLGVEHQVRADVMRHQVTLLDYLRLLF